MTNTTRDAAPLTHRAGVLVMREFSATVRTVMEKGRLTRLAVPRHAMSCLYHYHDLSRTTFESMCVYAVVGPEDAPIEACRLTAVKNVCFGDAARPVREGGMDPVEAFWNTDFAEESAALHFNGRGRQQQRLDVLEAIWQRANFDFELRRRPPTHPVRA